MAARAVAKQYHDFIRQQKKSYWEVRKGYEVDLANGWIQMQCICNIASEPYWSETTGHNKFVVVAREKKRNNNRHRIIQSQKRLLTFLANHASFWSQGEEPDHQSDSFPQMFDQEFAVVS